MKVVIVSAHYPPNFVSGGTLAPQRQAHGLRAMGHDVSVYAGWLGDRPALDTWTSCDSTGMSVRWVVTSPWIEYGDRNNFDNVAVAADFARHLAEVRPDLVHFHSVQTLGGRLLDAAAEAGCRIVVTMHDFWWSCARQFFVTRQFTPCPLVVSCGRCPCEVDARWLEARRVELCRHLDRADKVLAVSRSAAAVISANGVDPRRIGVDENGVPAPAAGFAERSGAEGGSATEHLRLTYTGGHLRLKGVHVLLDAIRTLGDLHGWRLAAYGAGPFVEQSQLGPTIAGLPVDVLPPFHPADAEAVFAATDVLVVPSVMRETYSLVTREALTRGIPVVCTDSLGPEEVVVHGENGLVVPTADAGALAAALTRLVTQPGLLERLRSGCREVRVRSMEEQVAGLDRLYRELLDAPPGGAVMGGPAGRTMRRVLFMVGIQGAPLRYRARLPAEALASLGVRTEVRHYRDHEVAALASEADALVVYRVPATKQILECIAGVRRRGAPVFFDVDDLIFDPDLAAEIPALSLLPAADADLWLEGVRRYRTTMEACDVFIGSTEALCRHAEEVVGLPAERFANGVGMELGRLSDAALARPRASGPLRVGYLSGTDTHDNDWRHVEPAVVRLLESRADIELWLVGLLRPTPTLEPFGSRVRRLPFQEWRGLPGLLRDLDVNLAPLQPESRFNDAKSAIKWLEAALCATPTVASPSEPFREVIRHGQNGLLAANEEEWTAALQALLDDGEMRGRLGRRAQRDALLDWSPHRQAHRYLEILEHGTERRRLDQDRGRAHWEPVVHDEPPMPVVLEPYGDATSDPSTPASPSPWTVVARAGAMCRSLAGKGWRSLVEEGPTATAHRAFDAARRILRSVEDHRRWWAAVRRARSSIR
ncbi:MAG: glycosyltransferase [Actinomycetota bacterium]|nr:glycosyltransferase [Actinomycetota bacterium]